MGSDLTLDLRRLFLPRGIKIVRQHPADVVLQLLCPPVRPAGKAANQHGVGDFRPAGLVQNVTAEARGSHDPSGLAEHPAAISPAQALGQAAVGSADGLVDITALGDSVNTAARLASQAAPGEIIISEDTVAASGLILDNLERRRLELKGRSKPIDVRLIQVRP